MQNSILAASGRGFMLLKKARSNCRELQDSRTEKEHDSEDLNTR